MQTVLICRRRLWAISPLVLMVAPAWPVRPAIRCSARRPRATCRSPIRKQFDERWDKTQLGQLFNDDIMQPFVEDFRKQLHEEFGAVERKLGLTWDDLKGVTAGEMSLSIIERKGQDAALAVTIDVTGHEKAGRRDARGGREALRRPKAAKRPRPKSATRRCRFSRCRRECAGKPQQTIYFIKDNLLCGVDDRAEAEAILKRFAGNATDNLKSVHGLHDDHGTLPQRSRPASSPKSRWFVEPFGFIFADPHAPQTHRRKEQDTAKILFDNGFDAIQGAGGYVNQLVEGHIEFLVRTSVYAPAVKGKENDPLRWNLSMRMLQLPNGPAVEPQSWAPRMVASYTTMNLKLTDAFDNVGPVFDAIQEHEDAWKNTLDGWQNDPYGPQVDVRKEFIGNMGNRISVMTTYDTPITENSERSVFAIEATNEKESGQDARKVDEATSAT